MERFYTMENLAELFQVSTRTILREKMSGKIPFVLIRGRVRFREQDVLNYVACAQAGAAASAGSRRMA